MIGQAKQANSRLTHEDRIIAVTRDSSASARSAIAASWARSVQRYGLDPHRPKPVRMLSEAELTTARESLGAMVRLAQSSLDQLFQAVGGVGCSVLLNDRHGVVLDRRGHPADDAVFQRSGLWPGAVWSEEAEGTNGIGTCLAEERALTIHRDQHFYARNTGFSCSAAPIYDHEGQLAAALDVSSARVDMTEAFVGLITIAVADAARRIESLNFRHAFAHSRVVVTPDLDRHNAGLLAIDRDDMVVGASHAARQAYGLTNAKLTKPIPVDALFSRTDDPADELKRAERGALRRALAATGGNVSAAARALGVSRATLHRKMKWLGIQSDH